MLECLESAYLSDFPVLLQVYVHPTNLVISHPWHFPMHLAQVMLWKGVLLLVRRIRFAQQATLVSLWWEEYHLGSRSRQKTIVPILLCGTEGVILQLFLPPIKTVHMVLFPLLLIVILLTCTVGAIRRMLYEKVARRILGLHN